MQIQELLKLINWVEENITEGLIIQKYTALQTAMNQNVTARNNQPMQSFEVQKDDLLTAIEKINFESLSIEQINLLEKLRIKDIFGKTGVLLLEKFLYKNSLDIAAATEKVTKITQDLNNAKAKLTAISTSLENIFDFSEDTEISVDSVFMRVYFSGESSINNVTHLKKLGAIWYEIGRGIAMANGKAPEDFKIVGAQKGSVVLEFVVGAGIATSVSTIILSGLKVTEKVLDILKKAEEIKKLKLENKSIAQEIENEAKKTREQGIESITKEIISVQKIKEKEEGDKVNALKKSIKNIIDFTEKGGVIDFIQPSENEEADGELKKFRKNYSEIRLLENRIKLLEQENNSEDSGE